MSETDVCVATYRRTSRRMIQNTSDRTCLQFSRDSAKQHFGEAPKLHLSYYYDSANSRGQLRIFRDRESEKSDSSRGQSSIRLLWKAFGHVGDISSVLIFAGDYPELPNRLIVERDVKLLGIPSGNYRIIEGGLSPVDRRMIQNHSILNPNKTIAVVPLR